MPQEAAVTIVKPKPLTEFKTPWEAKDEEYDPEKGRAFIHYLMTQAFEQQEAATKAKSDLATVTTEREALQEKVNEAARANETETERLTRELAEAKAKAAKADEPDIEKLKLKVALDKGLTLTQMKRLVGSTEEELAADADTLLAEWGPKRTDDEEEEETEDGSTPSTQPRSRLSNPGDPTPTEGKWDAEKAADEFMKRHGGLL